MFIRGDVVCFILTELLRLADWTELSPIKTKDFLLGAPPPRCTSFVCVVVLRLGLEPYGRDRWDGENAIVLLFFSSATLCGRVIRLLGWLLLGRLEFVF